MTKTKGVSPKLAAAVAPPLTAVVTHMILTGKVDRASLALLAAILIGAALGYHAPRGGAVTTAVTTTLGPPLIAATSNPASATSSWSVTGSPADEGDDGDDHLPGDLATRTPDAAPVDEIDVADLNHPEVK